MIRPVLCAAIMVLGGVALAAAPDWAVILPSGEIVCVRAPPPALGTAESLCREALNAAPFVPPGSRCEPRPGCIDRREDCITGYHGPRKEGYCR